MVFPKVAVILVNWNNHQDTLNCCSLIQKLDYPMGQISIIVVDNFSEESSRQALIEKKEWFTLISLNRNLGFAAGNNVGIQHALKGGRNQYVWILNNDVSFNADLLKQLLKPFELVDHIGIVSPKIQYSDPPGKIQYAGGVKEQFSIGHMIGMDEFDHGQYDRSRQVDFGIGCSLLISANVFEKVGLFDERFFFYHEDVDFCYRAQNQGFTIWYEPKGLIIHRASSSTQSNPALKYFHSASARVRFFKKYTKSSGLPAIWVIECYRFLRLCMVLCAHGKQEYISAYIHGIITGFQRD